MPASADVAGAEAQIDKIIEKSKALKKEQQLPIGEHRGHPLGSRLAMPEAKNGCSTPWQKRGRLSDVAPFDVSISNGHTL